MLKGVQELKTNVVRIQDLTHSFVDQQTGFVHTQYVYRSRPGDSRDVRIRVSFNDEILDVKYCFRGAVVMESGSRLSIKPDQKGFVFITNEFHSSNDLVFKITSKRPVVITAESMQP